MKPPRFKTRPVRVKCNVTGHPVGESHPNSRHSDEVVAEVRAMRDAGKTTAEIARELGISIHTIHSWSIGRRRNVPTARVIVRRWQVKEEA